VEDLQKSDYEEEIKRRSKRIFIPNWFTVDLKTGVNFTTTEFPVDADSILNIFLGLMRGMATLPQGNQELLVVRDKVGRSQVSLG